MTDSWTETTLGEVIEFYDHKRIPLSTKQKKPKARKVSVLRGIGNY